eukprot:360958-Chlamydomonas_euryale.AAC.16
MAHSTHHTPHADAARDMPHHNRRTQHATHHATHAGRSTPHTTRHTPDAARHMPHNNRRTQHATRHTPHATRLTVCPHRALAYTYAPAPQHAASVTNAHAAASCSITYRSRHRVAS